MPEKSKTSCLPCCLAVIAAPVLLVILIIGVSTLNVTYDYAVDRRTTSLPYRTYYSTEDGRDYDFHTVVFTLMGDMKGIHNYGTFTVYVSHPHLVLPHREGPGDYAAEIVFSDFTTDDPIELVPDSVNLFLHGKEGQVIPHLSLVNQLADKPQGKYRNHRYRKVYDSKHLPDEITEEITFEVIIGGERKKVEYRLPLKKVRHYSGWDVLMGI